MDCSKTVVIEANRYRKKSIVELSKEAKAAKEISNRKGKEKQSQAGGDKKKKALSQNSAEAVDTRKEVEKVTGVSHDTLKKIDVIIEEKPEAVKDIDEGKKTVHSVYGAIQQEKQKQEMWLIVGERCVAVKNTMCGLKQHRTA